MRILVIEDNRDILANVLDYLQLKGFSVDCAQDGLSGLHLASTGHYDFDRARHHASGHRRLSGMQNVCARMARTKYQSLC